MPSESPPAARLPADRPLRRKGTDSKSEEAPRRRGTGSRRCACIAGAALAVAGFYGRSQACCLFSLASYASLFVGLVHQTETVLRVGGGEQHSGAGTGFPALQPKVREATGLHVAVTDSAEGVAIGPRRTQPIEWCDFGQEGQLYRSYSPEEEVSAATTKTVVRGPVSHSRRRNGRFQRLF